MKYLPECFHWVYVQFRLMCQPWTRCGSWNILTYNVSHLPTVGMSIVFSDILALTTGCRRSFGERLVATCITTVSTTLICLCCSEIGPMAICLHRRCIIGMWKHYCVDSHSYQRSNTERRGCCSLDWVSQTGSSRQGLVRKAQHRGFAEKSILPEK